MMMTLRPYKPHAKPTATDHTSGKVRKHFACIQGLPVQAFSLCKFLSAKCLCLLMDHGLHLQRHRQSAHFKG